MKAAIYTQYGEPEVLQIQPVEKPIPKENEVLVKVHATSINYNTVALVTGKPFMVRLMTGGITRPGIKTPGNDIAGTVEAIGSNVTKFQPGDAVFGDTGEYGFGALAEYVTVPEKALTLKPDNATFEEAAAVPEAGLVALQALRDSGGLQKGQKVLIYGASGGIGSYAVQLAKAFGAEVTGVCSTRNIDMVRALGADHVIDYTKEDFSRSDQKYDLIIATAGYNPIFAYRRALSPNGTYVSTGGTMTQIFQSLLLGPLLSMFGNKKLRGMMVKPNKDLELMKELIEAGKVKTLIDKCYPLDEVVDALRYYASGRARGKIVISIAPQNT